MKQRWFRKSWIGSVSLLCFSVTGLSIIVLSNGRQLQWRFRTQSPIPAEATSLKVSYPSNEVQRIIEFEVDREAAHRVQQFYRTELLEDGWRYRCTVDTPLDTSMEFMDVYERRTIQNQKGETLEIAFRKQYLQGAETSGRKRVILLREWLTLSFACKGL